VASLYFDADIKPAFRHLLRPFGHDVLTTQDLHQIHATDAEQLVTATQLGRTLVTHNGKDFRTLCRAWPIWRRTWGLDPADQAGVIATPQQTLLPYDQAANQIERLLDRQRDLRNQVWFFDLRVGDWVRQV
jgi:hypothetical protein